MSKSFKALAVGRSQDWSTSIYCFSRAHRNNLIWEKDAAARKTLKHYFQHHLTSTPNFKHTSAAVTIQMYYHSDPVTTEISKFTLAPLQTLLSDLYGPQKRVELRLIRLNYPYLDPEILAQYLALNSQRSSWGNLTRKFMRSVPIIKPPTVTVRSPSPIHWGNLLPHAANPGIVSVIQGIKYEVSGRLGRRRGASRKSIMRKSVGTFKFTSTSSLIHAGRHTFTNKNGKITVKVWISTALFGVGAVARAIAAKGAAGMR